MTHAIQNPDGSVSVTIPLTITIQIGPAVLQAPLQGVYTGTNWDKGWYAYCRFCRCNRWLVLHADFNRTRPIMAYCNVCEAFLITPTDNDQDIPWDFIANQVLMYQKQCPGVAIPPPQS